MTLAEVAATLRLDAAGVELLAPHWEESAAALPPHPPAFIDPQRCTELRSWTDMPAEVDEDLTEVARQVAASPALRQLAWHCHRLLYSHPEYPSGDIARWPWLEEALGPNHGLFYALVALSAVPLVQAFHRRRGIPEQITRDTVGHQRKALRLRYHEAEGRWTVILAALYWTRYHAWGDLYSCGRMEYMIRPFCSLVKAYRHQQTGHVLALLNGEHVVTAEGYLNSGETLDSAPGNWQSTLTEYPDRVLGYPVRPSGTAINQPVELALREWDLALQPGDPMLDVHIPAGGDFSPEKCQDSMARALAFFTRYLPDRPYVGFACGSWILDPGIAQWYRPDSNMVQWQNELYLFPYPSGPRTGLFFLFDNGDIDLATAPRDTSMRRAILDHLQSGGRTRAGGMFMLKEDFPHYGEQHYRHHWGGELLGLE